LPSLRRSAERRVAVPAVVLLVVAALVARVQVTPDLGWELDRGRIDDSLALAAFELQPEIVDAAGRPLAWHASGQRHWADVPQLAAIAGAGGPIVADRGLEAHPAVADGGCPVHPITRLTCRTPTVHATVDLEVQREVAQVAVDHAVDVVVLDAAGGVVAAADAAPVRTDPRGASLSADGPDRPAALTRLSAPGSVAKLVTAVAVPPDGAGSAWPAAPAAADDCADAGWPGAFLLSCNGPFVAAVADLPEERWLDAARSLALTGDAGAALGWPGEPARLPGVLSDLRLADATLGGGGMAITPLHGALAALTIANGRTASPSLVAGEAVHGETVPVGYLRDAMLACVTDPAGTCRNVVVPPGWEVGAKTGTAELGDRTDGWMVGFARPQPGDRLWAIAVRAAALEPGHRRSGGADAAEAFGAVLQAISRNAPADTPR
jgi:hypothetical protein